MNSGNEATLAKTLARLRALASANAATGDDETEYCGSCHAGWRQRPGSEGGGVEPCPCRDGVLRRHRQSEINEVLARYHAGVGSKLKSVSPLTFLVRPEQGHVKMALDRHLSELREVKERSGRVRGGGWLVLGPPGVGKSWVASYLVNRVRAEGWGTAAMVNFPRLLSALRATFRVETDHAALFRILYETDVLAVDDLGMEKKVRADEDAASSWGVQEFYKVIDHRFDEERPTLITTNRSLDELEERFGPAIYSRIRGMTNRLDLSGEDGRR